MIVQYNLIYQKYEPTINASWNGAYFTPTFGGIANSKCINHIFHLSWNTKRWIQVRLVASNLGQQ